MFIREESFHWSFYFPVKPNMRIFQLVMFDWKVYSQYIKMIILSFP
jgi:hypothetical protein